MTTNPIKLNSLLADYRAMRGMRALPHCKYLWGQKPDPNLLPSNVKSSDCSGVMAYWLKRRGFPNSFPSSSIEQGEWFKAHQDVYPKKEYADVLKYCKHDFGRLFVAGFAYEGTRRHILMVHNGVTIECGSSLFGVSSRPAEAFADEVQWCAEIPVDLT